MLKVLCNKQSLLYIALIKNSLSESKIVESEIELVSKQWINEKMEIAFLISVIFLYNTTRMETVEVLNSHCKKCDSDDILIPYFLTALCTKFCGYGTQIDPLISTKNTLDRFRALTEGNWTSKPFQNLLITLSALYFKINHEHLLELGIEIDFSNISKNADTVLQQGALQFLAHLTCILQNNSSQNSELNRLFLDISPQCKSFITRNPNSIIKDDSSQISRNYSELSQYFTPIIGGTIILFIKSKIEVIRSMRNKEEDVDLSDKAPNNSIILSNSSYETLLFIITTVFQHKDQGTEFWTNVDLKPFLRLCWETRSPKLLKAFILMLSSLSMGQLCAGFSHEYLMNDGKVSYSTLLRSMNTISSSLQKNSGSIIDPSEESSLIVFLFLFETTVRYSHDAKFILVEHQNFKALSSITSLLISPISLKVKTALFNCLEAFCQTKDEDLSLLIIPKIFSFINESRMLQSESLLQGGLAYDLHVLESSLCTFTTTISFLNLFKTLLENEYFLEALFLNRKEDLLVSFTEFVVDKVIVSMNERIFVQISQKYEMISYSLQITLSNLKHLSTLIANSSLDFTSLFAQSVLALLSNEKFFIIVSSLFSAESTKPMSLNEDATELKDALKLGILVLLESLSISEALLNSQTAFTHTANYMVSHQHIIPEIACLINLVDAYDIQLLSVELISRLSKTLQFNISNVTHVHDLLVTRLTSILYTSNERNQIVFGYGHALENSSVDSFELKSKIIELLFTSAESNATLSSIGYFLLGYDITSDLQHNEMAYTLVNRIGKSTLTVISGILHQKLYLKSLSDYTLESVYLYVAYLKVIHNLCLNKKTSAEILKFLKSGDQYLMPSQITYIVDFYSKFSSSEHRTLLHVAEAGSLILKIVSIELHDATIFGQTSYAESMIDRLLYQNIDDASSNGSNQNYSNLLALFSSFDLCLETDSSFELSNVLNIQADCVFIDDYQVSLFDLDAIKSALDANDFYKDEDITTIEEILSQFSRHNNFERYKVAIYTETKSWASLLALILSSSHVSKISDRKSILAIIIDKIRSGSCELSLNALSEPVFYLTRSITSGNGIIESLNIYNGICSNLLAIIKSSNLNQNSRCNFALSLEHLIATSPELQTFTSQHALELIEVYMNILPQANDFGRVISFNLITRILQTAQEPPKDSIYEYFQTQNYAGFLINILEKIDAYSKSPTSSIVYSYESLLLLVLEISNNTSGSQLLLNALCLDTLVSSSLFDHEIECAFFTLIFI